MSSSAPEANGSSHLISDFEQYLSTDGKARKSGSLSNLIFKFAGVPDVVGFHGDPLDPSHLRHQNLLTGCCDQLP